MIETKLIMYGIVGLVLFIYLMLAFMGIKPTDWIEEYVDNKETGRLLK